MRGRRRRGRRAGARHRAARRTGAATADRRHRRHRAPAPPPTPGPHRRRSTPARRPAARPPARPTACGPAPARRRADPPRESLRAAWKRREAVVADDEFQLIVGLVGRTGRRACSNPQIVRPETSVGPYTLVVQVVADGFSLVDGASGAASCRSPRPSRIRRRRTTCAPSRNPADVWSRPIQALYSIDGQTVGVAIRTIAIVARAELLGSGAAAGGAGRERDRGRAADRTRPISPRASPTAKPSPTVGCCGRSRRRTASTCPPRRSSPTSGAGPQVFARELIAGVASHRGDPGLVEFLTGHRPHREREGARAVLRRCSPRSRRRLDRPPARAVALAGAVRAVGARGGRARARRTSRAAVPRRASRRRPVGVRPAPARASAAASKSTRDDIAVVSGVYPDTAWRLVDAEEEAATLVNAVARDVGRRGRRDGASSASRDNHRPTSCTSRCTARTHPRACSKGSSSSTANGSIRWS